MDVNSVCYNEGAGNLWRVPLTLAIKLQVSSRNSTNVVV